MDIYKGLILYDEKGKIGFGETHKSLNKKTNKFASHAWPRSVKVAKKTPASILVVLDSHKKPPVLQKLSLLSCTSLL